MKQSNEMTHSSVSQFRSEFDEFLYAPVDDGNSGTFLSVISALARLGVDPWQEAASLARMSREKATQRLASLIGSLPGGLLAHLDSKTVAARLIALLPHPPNITTVASGMSPHVAAVINSRIIAYVVIINLIFLALTLGSHYVMSDHKAPTQIGHAHVPVTDMTAPKVAPPNFRK